MEKYHTSPVVKAVKKALPSVVSVVMEKHLDNLLSPFNDLGEGYKHAQKRQPMKLGGGTGFIINSNGTILTNRHVVEDPKADYVVVLQNDRKLKPKVLARDPIHDIAILKINPGEALEGPLTALKMGDSSCVQLGEDIIAIGNALGLFKNTVSTGVISGLSREIQAQSELSHEKTKLRGLIQIDAAINPGNSGGPLINLDGEVIGINAAMVFGAENIGFALPINNAKKALQELKEYGRIRLPYLGLRYLPINAVLKEQFGLPVTRGALVMSEPTIPQGFRQAVVPNSPAARAGIKEADIIMTINNQEVTDEKTINDILSSYDVGQKLSLEILRGGEKKTLKTILGERKLKK